MVEDDGFWVVDDFFGYFVVWVNGYVVYDFGFVVVEEFGVDLVW